MLQSQESSERYSTDIYIPGRPSLLIGDPLCVANTASRCHQAAKEWDRFNQSVMNGSALSLRLLAVLLLCSTLFCSSNCPGLLSTYSYPKSSSSAVDHIAVDRIVVVEHIADQGLYGEVSMLSPSSPRVQKLSEP